MPPSEGQWLARSSRRRTSFFDPIEYLRPLSEDEFTSLRSAFEYFKLVKRRPEVRPLFDAYENWQSALGHAAEASRLGGPVHEQFVEDRLVAFLLVWRMTIDQLKATTLSCFGKASKQWEAYETGRTCAYDTHFGYRIIEGMRNFIQHYQRPPLIQTIERYPYVCERCGEEHASLDLSVTVPTECFLEWEKCPSTLRRDLVDRADEFVDMRVAVAQSMRGFEDFLYTLITANDKASYYLTVLVNSFRETAPEVPVLIEWQVAGHDNKRSTIKQLYDMDWVITRAVI